MARKGEGRLQKNPHSGYHSEIANNPTTIAHSHTQVFLTRRPLTQHDHYNKAKTEGQAYSFMETLQFF